MEHRTVTPAANSYLLVFFELAALACEKFLHKEKSATAGETVADYFTGEC
jgi:hypothetical protein